MSELSNISTGQYQEPEVVDNPDADLDWVDQWNYARAAGNKEMERKVVSDALQIPQEDIVDTPQGLAYKKDGKLHLVEPTDFNSRAWQLGADLAAKPGAVVGGAVGSVGGPLGIVAGSAAGDLVQSGIEEVFEGHERSAGEYAKSAGTEAAFAGAGEMVFRGGKWVWRSVKDKFADDAVEGVDEAYELAQQAESQGIPLTPAEVLNDRQGLNVQSWLRDLPNSASGKVDDYMASRVPHVATAIEKVVGTKSPQQAYNEQIARLNSSRTGMVEKRLDESSEFYNKAAGYKVKDMKPIVEGLKKQIDETSGTKIGSSLNRVYKAVTRMKDGEQIPKELIGELHYAKMDIDDMIEVAHRKGQNNNVRILTKVKNQLVDVLEEASSDYKLGRESYIENSAPIKSFDDGLEGSILKEGKKSSPQLSKLVFGPTSSPEAVKRLRTSIGNDEVFGDMVRAHLKTEFNKLNSSATGEVTNLGGLFYKQVFGSEYKRSLLKAALPSEQYKAINDLMTILEATGRGFKGNSTTAQRTLMNERASGLPVVGKLNASKRLQEWNFDRVSEKMADLLTNDYSQYELAQIAKQIREFARAGDKEGISKLEDALSAGAGLLGLQAARED
ncbi:MAG: hypothetical protein DRQ40_08935 [Gammaproteobacteria bacterium]|nr:MAG: hypothetical protein DRQ40_08935 [Gammaproteobacteria bacterium]